VLVCFNCLTSPIPALPSPAGAIEGLKSLKQARITDPTTGQSFGLVRLYADPGEPPAAVVHKPARPAKPAAHHRGGTGAASSKPVQVHSAFCAQAAA